MVAFSGAMFGLVVSDNMLVLYVFWELTSVLSFLLVGHYAERATSRRAATQALMVTTAGGLAMLVGIIILGQCAGTYLLSELVAHPPSGLAVNVALVLVLIGALSKSAIVPMHFWLPGAMAAPTPVSAYLHAAAMVKAGVYLIARLTPGFADAPPWRPMIVVLGLLTMLLAGWRAVREYDLKLILAFGTVSQLGLITVLVGTGGGDLMLAGLTMLCAHAMFKAALFMVVGVIDHATGTRDIRRLAWLGHRLPVLFAIAAAATASMAALPPFLGFVAKEADFETLLHSASLGAVGAVGARRRGRRVGVHHRLQPAIPLGSVRAQGITRAEHAGGRAAPHRRRASCSRPACSPRRAWCSGLTPGLLERHARALRRLRSRRFRPTTWRCGTGSTCRCCCRSGVLAVGHRVVRRARAAAPAALGPAAARQRRPDLRRDAARPGIPRVQGDRRDPARFDTGDPVGHPGDPGGAAGRGADPRCPRPPEPAVLGGPAAAGGRPADDGGRARGHRDAQPAGRGAAGRRHRLRLRCHLRASTAHPTWR